MAATQLSNVPKTETVRRRDGDHLEENFISDQVLSTGPSESEERR